MNRQLRDVASLLRDVHLVYTATIEVGVNYTEEHFTNLLMYTSSCSNIVRDSIQGMARVQRSESESVLGYIPRVCW